ncbi:MAG: hypothetical protein US50_C0015G0018 [Candidatus Nomurabacteria bacterium GW2011_GWB1_37_5]|uniref:DUF1573 domain-containing protein n=1 Tax=Candidatus Nomurabacteria bacterium GW2011_GWB1_37_5 TaxID=1618742 RepID=A0A0G0K460_9BACT|nr:MAG: hypothetical protein US50_C0015G0018 [Candidatus Nomurabacteria bacterium GW2011_GWB1_37_5]
MKNKNTIISIITIIIIFAGLIFIAKPNQNKNEKADAAPIAVSSASALEAAETFFNFEDVSMANGKVRHEFKVKNNTVNPINIAKLYTSCMCTSASITVGENKKGPFGMPGHAAVPKANMLIGAGEEAIITAEFDPNAHGPAGVGRIEREIYLEDDAGAKTTLKFEATVKP